jgi:hypothetical protein
MPGTVICAPVCLAGTATVSSHDDEPDIGGRALARSTQGAGGMEIAYAGELSTVLSSCSIVHFKV